MSRLISATLALTLAAGAAAPALADEVPAAPPQVVEETAGFDHQARPLMLALAGVVLFILANGGDDDSAGEAGGPAG
ncbi:hypothetical protein ACXN5S_02375 [Pseudoroseicyclus sp. H15]